MSLPAFQRIIVELIVAPGRVRRLLQGDLALLEGYDLTEREQRRVLDAIRQPGMALNCTIARGNRFEAVAELFPMTCVLLKPVLRELLDELWEDAPPTSYQFTGEEEAFTGMVRQKIATGELAIEYLDEIFDYESRCAELAQWMRGQPTTDLEREAVIEFHHPPDLLLLPLSEHTAPPSGLPTGIYRARLTMRGDQFDVEMLSASPDGPDGGMPG
jgi:hypothetical protein